MSVNSKLPAQTNNTWVRAAEALLKTVGVPSARLDAELLLAAALGVERVWVIAHGDETLKPVSLQKANELLAKRADRMPIAYLRGTKEFYGRDFVVTPVALIPRPETETLVDLAKKHHLNGRILDVGTGSGCVGLTLALETGATLTLCDISEPALAVAKQNAELLGVKPVRFVHSNLLDHWLNHARPKPFDVIVTNLPYVDRSWVRSPETDHEPALALFADDGGLEIIKALIDQAPALLAKGGHLLLEADPEQHELIVDYAKSTFALVESQDYAVLLQKK